MGDGHHADNVTPSIDFVHDPKAPDAETPEGLQIALKRRTDRRIRANGAEGRFDRVFDFWREMAENLGNVRGDVELERSHSAAYRAGLFLSTTGSPNTSSNDRPFACLA